MKIALAAAAALALAACGGGSTGAVSPGDVTAYQSATLSASAAVTQYQAAAGTMTTQAECQAAVQQYAARMSTALQTMHQHAAEMDDHMRAMGQAGAADMSCGAEVMAQLLEQHRAAACSSSDMAQNQQLAVAHCQAMAADADHLQMRAAAMGSTTSGGTGSMGSGGMMGGGGTTPDMGTMMDAGYTAADGHHMSWGEPMHGCTMSGGTYQPSTTPTTGG